MWLTTPVGLVNISGCHTLMTLSAPVKYELLIVKYTVKFQKTRVCYTIL